MTATHKYFVFYFQSKRLGALNKFKSKDRSILIATDVASRGLDIPHVDVVINFDIPTHSKVQTCIQCIETETSTFFENMLSVPKGKWFSGKKSKFRVTDNVQGQIFKPFIKLSKGYRMYK